MISNCAVIDLTTDYVLNVIVADPDVDPPYPGTVLVAVPADISIGTDCTWTEATGFVCPGAAE